MDRTGIIVIALCAVLLGLWVVEQKKTADQQALYMATNTVSTVQTPAQAPAATSAQSAPATQTTSIASAAFDTNVPENLIVITNGRARYTFTSRGGGLARVDLLDYPESISARWHEIDTNIPVGVASLNTRAPLPVLAMIGNTNLVGNGDFTLIPMTNGVRADKVLPDGLRIVKEFQFGSNYLINASVWLQNMTTHPLPVPSQQIVIGTATPMDPDDSMAGISGGFPAYGGTMWYDGSRYYPITLNYFNPSTTSFFGMISRTPQTEFQAGNSNVMWAAAYNQFYLVLAMPKTPAQAVYSVPVTLPQFPNVEVPPGAQLPRGIQAGLIYPAQTLTTNSSIEHQITIYAGPKEYRTLADIAEQNGNNANEAMNFGRGYISFWGVGTFFAKLLLLGMNWLHDTLKMGYGWTIVVITVALRVVFWPLTRKTIRSAKKMQALGPEIKALKEKYKDDQQKFAQKQWELYSKNKVSPLSGCFPMLIQMPVFFGFLSMIRSAIELRGAHFLWVADLTRPDTVFLIPGTEIPFNLLPLLMVGAMVWQAHLQPQTPGMDPAQQKMMRYMPLMFLLFLYSYSSAMALYMTVSTLLGVLQTAITRNLKDPAAPGLTVAPKSKK